MKCPIGTTAKRIGPVGSDDYEIEDHALIADPDGGKGIRVPRCKSTVTQITQENLETASALCPKHGAVAMNLRIWWKETGLKKPAPFKRKPLLPAPAPAGNGRPDAPFKRRKGMK